MIFVKPKVHLICRPQLDWSGINAVLKEDFDNANWARTANNDGELLVEFMGRMCYGSFGENQGRHNSTDYLLNILAQGHGSVLEHASWSFIVTRAGRGYTHQAVRHRAGWAFSQESTHFIQYKDLRLCFPGIPEAHWPEAVEAATKAFDTYKAIFSNLAPLPKKTRLGIARAVLPNALESKLGFTANLRALRHFCEMRGGPDNVVEIRLVAEQIVTIMQQEAPIVFSDFTITTADDGYPAVSSKWVKV